MIGNLYIAVAVLFCLYRVILGIIDSKLVSKDQDFLKKGKYKWLLLFDIPYPNSAYVSDKFLQEHKFLFFVIHGSNFCFVFLLLVPVVIAIALSF